MAEPMEVDIEALPGPKCSIARMIDYVGNGVIMMEILLIVSMTAALMLRVGGWLGVALVLYLVPAFIMILALTNALKKQLGHKYLYR